MPHTPSTEKPIPEDDNGDGIPDVPEGAGSGADDGDDGEGSQGGDQQPVPEPSTLVLVGSGIALISLCRKKKKQQEKLGEQDNLKE
ncbi:MAG: PEP-CTERM sorting domain-containing protein [Planctomycetes bacterium]|nr:PEP-CTERM sorting domain-containing protein [Planctomycetota bacterium]